MFNVYVPTKVCRKILGSRLGLIQHIEKKEYQNKIFLEKYEQKEYNF